MIFVTVGHQMPFNRLVRAVDQWAHRGGRRDIFAQIGNTSYHPINFDSARFLSPQQFQQRMQDASAIVAHAGTGTIIAALQLGKPLLVMPRMAKLGETRNDHQIPTAQRFAEQGHVLAALDEKELEQRLNELATFRPRCAIGAAASPELIRRLREFAFGIESEIPA